MGLIFVAYCDVVCPWSLMFCYLHGTLALSRCTFRFLAIHYQSFCIFFLSFQDDDLAGEKCYVIGGASIYCARSVLEVLPIWPSHLERLFALSEAEFSKCSSTLLATYEEAEGNSQEPKSTKEVLEFLEVGIYLSMIVGVVNSFQCQV